MSFADQANIWLAENRWVFLTILFGTCLLTITLFTVSLVHVWKGQRMFVIILNLAILQSAICYTVFAYQVAVAYSGWKFMYFCAMESFGLYHWILAMRYFKSASEMPYVLDGKPIPETLSMTIKVIDWLAITLDVITPFYVFMGAGWLKQTMFLTWCVTMFAAAVLMTIALVKIRKNFLAKGLGEATSSGRMVLHALAFLVYVVEYVFLTLLSY